MQPISVAISKDLQNQAQYGNSKKVIKPVLRDPESPTKIKSALKMSPAKAINGQDTSKDSSRDDMRLSTIKGFSAARTVSFDVDN